MIHLIREHLGNLLFPRSCIGCNAPGTWICPSCERSIHPLLEQECFVCRKTKTPRGESCFSCRKKSVLDGVFVAAPYRNRILAEAIHVFKYEYIDELAPLLGKILAESVNHSALPIPHLIIPVPLHPWRKRFRGFNQSTLLARELAERSFPELAVPVEEAVLLRKRFTLPQAKTSHATERKENLSGAFGLAKQSDKKALRGKTIWLVDDVFTTGTTLEECARVLRTAGAKKIFGIVLAR